jgi:hypothetical protein
MPIATGRSQSPFSGISEVAWHARTLSQPTVQSLNVLSSPGCGAAAAAASIARISIMIEC